jgi:uncharacterized protein
MQELPLFPLQTVLFPNAPLRLHIFEERYKTMVHHCELSQQPFGVVLIRHGAEANGPLAEPYSLGTTAQIIQAQRLSDGRMNITIVGQDRFQIVSLEPDLQPYLVGYVEPLIVVRTDPGVLAAKASVLRNRLNRYLHTLAESGVSQFDSSQFPEDPVELAYICATILQLSNLQKQALLTIDCAEDLVDAVSQAFRQELALLKAILAKADVPGEVFSTN